MRQVTVDAVTLQVDFPKLLYKAAAALRMEKPGRGIPKRITESDKERLILYYTGMVDAQNRKLSPASGL
jgi:hypothetical protein